MRLTVVSTLGSGVFDFQPQNFTADELQAFLKKENLLPDNNYQIAYAYVAPTGTKFNGTLVNPTDNIPVAPVMVVTVTLKEVKANQDEVDAETKESIRQVLEKGDRYEMVRFAALLKKQVPSFLVGRNASQTSAEDLKAEFQRLIEVKEEEEEDRSALNVKLENLTVVVQDLTEQVQVVQAQFKDLCDHFLFMPIV